MVRWVADSRIAESLRLFSNSGGKSQTCEKRRSALQYHIILFEHPLIRRCAPPSPPGGRGQDFPLACVWAAVVNWRRGSPCSASHC